MAILNIDHFVPAIVPYFWKSELKQYQCQLPRNICKFGFRENDNQIDVTIDITILVLRIAQVVIEARLARRCLNIDATRTAWARDANGNESIGKPFQTLYICCNGLFVISISSRNQYSYFVIMLWIGHCVLTLQHNGSVPPCDGNV